MIPFDETRNYVMRVAEALPVYRARIKGTPVPLVPTWDLTGGGMKPAPAPPPIRLVRSARPLMTTRSLTGYAAGGALAEVLGQAAFSVEEANAAPLSSVRPARAGVRATR
ncbi:hypothetical protein ACFSS8_01855 [Paracoccus kondratievae]